MKVLHVIPSVGPARGGPSFALPALARAMVRAGAEVHVASTDDNGPDAHLAVPLDEPVVQEDGVVMHYFRRQTRFYTASWPLTYWLQRHVGEYDVVHIHALFSYASIPGALFAAHRGVPYVVRPLGTLNRWGMRYRRPLLKQLSFALVERRILAGAAAIHYTSEQEREEAAELGVTGASVVIPLGLDLAEFDNLPSPQSFITRYPSLTGRVVILYLSRLHQKKGLELLLSAFADVVRAHPETALILAGSGEDGYTEELRQLAEQLGIQDSVVWTGFLAGEEKIAALAAAEIFVLPSYSENFGIAPVEAMAAAVPVVISDQIGIADEVRQWDAGIVVPCSVHEIAAALRTLVLDPALRDRLGARGRDLVHQRFSSERASEALLQLYQRVSHREASLASR